MTDGLMRKGVKSPLRLLVRVRGGYLGSGEELGSVFEMSVSPRRLFLDDTRSMSKESPGFLPVRTSPLSGGMVLYSLTVDDEDGATPDKPEYGVCDEDEDGVGRSTPSSL